MTTTAVAPVIPLPGCVDRIGTRCFRWFCWRCGRFSSRPATRRDTCVRQLDRHAHAFHNVP